jgi:hypothetical protein
MSPKDYASAVIAERAALNRLQRLLKVHGSPVSKLDALDAAWAAWRELAGMLEAAGAEGGE